MEKTFFVVIPFYPNARPPDKEGRDELPPFLRKKENKAEEAKDTAEAESILQEKFAQLTQRVSQVTTGLSAIGLETTVLEDERSSNSSIISITRRPPSGRNHAPQEK